MPNWLIKLLVLVLPLVTPELRDKLVEFAKSFREDAKATDNPLDDVLAAILCGLLGID